MSSTLQTIIIPFVLQVYVIGPLRMTLL